MLPAAHSELRRRLLHGSALPIVVSGCPAANARTAGARTTDSQAASRSTRSFPTPPAGPNISADTGGARSFAASGTETISVHGQGSTRQLTSVSAKTIRAAAPFDAYEGSARVYVRGFVRSRLGFTLDDIPLGDQSFNNYNGLSITRAIISDNVARANVSQGAGSVSIALSSNLGDALQFYSADPFDNHGGTIEQTFGSNDTYRTFVRRESGALHRTETKFFVSCACTDPDKGKREGDNESDQVNAKLVQPIGNKPSLKLFLDWSAIKQFDYQDEFPNYLQTLGGRVDNYYPAYAAAYQAAEGIYTRNETLTNDLDYVAYDAGTA